MKQYIIIVKQCIDNITGMKVVWVVSTRNIEGWVVLRRFRTTANFKDSDIACWGDFIPIGFPQYPKIGDST